MNDSIESEIMNRFEAFIIMVGLTLSYFLLFGIDQNAQIHVTIRALILSIFVGVIKKRKLKQFNHYPQVVIVFGIGTQLISTLIEIISPSDQDSLVKMYLVIMTFIIYIRNRVYIGWIDRLSLVTTICYGLIQLFNMNMIRIIVVMQIIFYSTQKRIQIYKQQQEKIKSFEEQIESLQQNHNQKINELQEELENRHYQATTSRANELLKKLRLMKYSILINKNEHAKMIFKRRNSKRSSDVHKSTISLDDIPDEQSQKLIQVEKPKNFIQRKSIRLMSSHTEYQKVQELHKHNSSNSFSSSENKISNKEDVQMTIDDIDDLLNMLSGKKDLMYLPKFLRSQKQISGFEQNDNTTLNENNSKEEITADAKKFLISHFTQRESSFKYIDDIDLDGKSVVIDKIFDFNQDFLKFNHQTRAFVENSAVLFQKFNIEKTLRLKSNDIIKDFNFRVDSLYNQNLYHNSLHAIDVANGTAFFIQNGLFQLIDEFDVACLIISSLAHDLGHPGLNNGFLVTNRCKLALLFNDQSVLENYHAFLLFQVIRQIDICQNLTPQEMKGFRKYCLTLILDTDLTKHFQLMNRFQNYLELDEKPQNEGDKMLIMSIAIKCADVGHGAKELKLHKLWSRRIIEEFFLQGDLEQQLNVQISPMCDRKQCVSRSQEGFLKAIVLPMFDVFSKLLQSETIKNVCLKQIEQNIEYWQSQEQDKQFMKDTEMDICKIDHLMKFYTQPLEIVIQ